jgi:hypothetical protein
MEAHSHEAHFRIRAFRHIAPLKSLISGGSSRTSKRQCSMPMAPRTPTPCDATNCRPVPTPASNLLPASAIGSCSTGSLPVRLRDCGTGYSSIGGWFPAIDLTILVFLAIPFVAAQFGSPLSD